MGLKIMRVRDGAPRETWYARFTRNGQKVNVNLCVPIRGKVGDYCDPSAKAQETVSAPDPQVVESIDAIRIGIHTLRSDMEERKARNRAVRTRTETRQTNSVSAFPFAVFEIAIPQIP